ncbi:MAG: hypothetical protein JJT96_02640 [Opitutales bacterium]|nr:hypothetical protein [Opitutales bacterium]
MNASAFAHLRASFFESLLDSVLTTDSNGIPSIADRNQKSSIAISQGIVRRLGEIQMATKVAGQISGNSFETNCLEFIEKAFGLLSHLRPGNWGIERVTNPRSDGVARFEQYAHLTALKRLAKVDADLAASLGNDYAVLPDILLFRWPEEDADINRHSPLVDESLARQTGLRRINNPLPLIHASVSCKWTLRSDRAQNARSEALHLIRNRKGGCPHILFVTAEPSPSRLSPLALGTGDIDCVYHVALPELIESVREIDNDEALAMLMMMVEGKRLKDLTDLPLDLAV